jgi:soluble lytic murein transglycosylase
LDDLAETELRFGAKTDGQPQIIAVELAELANRRDAPDQAIRYIKRFASGYLSLSLDNAPDKFWRLAFPLPYRHSLEEYSRQQSLDPFLVAALIRQESEFNTKAVSRANARGLTQVMPSTGRQLSRQLKIPRYRTSMLFSPDTNLKIGTYYLKALSDQLQGRWEETLASYNAGKSRVNSWTSSANYHEPAEFVESIPFSETRVYVQSVLRNAEVYRRLYGPKAR